MWATLFPKSPYDTKREYLKAPLKHKSYGKDPQEVKQLMHPFRATFRQAIPGVGKAILVSAFIWKFLEFAQNAPEIPSNSPSHFTANEQYIYDQRLDPIKHNWHHEISYYGPGPRPKHLDALFAPKEDDQQ